MRKVFLIVAQIFNTYVYTQDSTQGSLAISGYAEVYFLYDFNKPANNNRPEFIYSHNRHNEINLNLGFLKANYSSLKIRANLAMGVGTYMNANYAFEPGVLKNIFEANAGFKLGKKDLWLDFGIMPSHIGFESATSKDCWTLTRSILADNSPYFEAGAKITYRSNNGKWLISGIVLNGWQRITRLEGNSRMSWGSQIQFKVLDKILLNYSSFAGTDKPDSTSLNRLFHNFYAVFDLTGNIGITAGFDIGKEKKPSLSNGNYTWYSPVLIIKYSFNDKWVMAARGEYYCDANGVIIVTGTFHGFRTKGFSLNLDHRFTKNAIARIEVRTFNSMDKIFIKENGLSNNNTFITAALAVSF